MRENILQLVSKGRKQWVGQEVFLSLKIPSYSPCFVGPDTVMEKDNIVGGEDCMLAADLLYNFG